MQNNVYNGRVNLYPDSGRISDYVTCERSGSSDGYDLLSANVQHTPVSALFLSKTNIDALQTGICNMVFNKSNGKYNIGPQSESDLKIIMRSIYLESLRGGIPDLKNGMQPINDPENMTVIGRVRQLNKKVLEWSVPRIITNIQQFERYKSDVSKLPNPMDNPTFVSSAGSKHLELQSFF